MKRILFSGLTALLALATINSDAQRSCGTALLHHRMKQEQPAAYRELVRDHMTQAAFAQKNAETASKTTAASPVPVVFHILLSATKYASMGGDAGIQRRVATQIAALNRDFNRKNADSTKIPAAFKSRYASAGIQFGQATTTSASTIAPGIEVKILTSAASYDIYNGCRAAKENTSIGLPAWNPRKYLNIWVMDMPSSVLGLTISPDAIAQQFGTRRIDSTDLGVALHYLAFGVRDNSAQAFNLVNDQGRTLTHEMGHYFGLWHIWGDDDFDNEDGYCDGERDSNGNLVGDNDGIGDTPDQSRRTYCDFPNHTGSNNPPFPLLDKCSPVSPGVMWMNFMDYVDDAAMQMFTTGQAAMMQSEIRQGSYSYSLTQQPGLASLSVPKVSEQAFHIYPNPAGEVIHVGLGGNEKLQSIQLTSLTGQMVREIQADGSRDYTLRTGDLPRGMYFVQCRFEEGAFSRKIVLQ